MHNYDVAIIGAGPAGIATAIQLKRYGLNPLVFEKGEIGGLLKNANLVENYIGFPEGISGKELVKLFQKQFENNQINIIYEDVQKVEYKDFLFEITTNKGIMTFKKLVIATGTKPKKISLEKDSNKIFYEISQIFNTRNKKIAIIGGGDAAFDYGLSLSVHNSVVILNRSTRIKCLKALFNKCKDKENLKYISKIKLKEIQEHNDGLSLICDYDNITRELYADYLLIAVGREPMLDFLSDNIKSRLDEFQKEKLIYLIGDVKNKDYRQTAISTGDGIRAAMEIFDKISQENAKE